MVIIQPTIPPNQRAQVVAAACSRVRAKVKAYTTCAMCAAGDHDWRDLGPVECCDCCSTYQTN